MSKSYIQFAPVESQAAGRKTKYWDVLTVEPPIASLGYIDWYSRWRCHAFNPAVGTVYERRCLRDIADFCEAETRKHMAAVRSKT